jgi:hypothetical protein
MSPKTLVVCYSLGGTTRRVAQELAEKLGADLDEIEDANPRKGVLGYVRSVVEAATRGLPSIRWRKDPRDYELVVLGTPVWTGTMAAPMRAYLFLHQPHLLARVAFFCTQAGRGGVHTVREMMALTGVEHAKSLVLLEDDVAAGRHRERLSSFAASLEAKPHTFRAAARSAS